jgi:RimJ/RimL family protein N-acetyltransferase
MVLRPWTPLDRTRWHELATHRAVITHICDGTPPTEAAIEAQFEHACQDTNGPALFACEQLDEPGMIIGAVGFAPPTLLPELLPVHEIGWRLFPEYWGRGFATEAASTALSWAFAADLLDRVVVVVQPANHRSAAVAERLGLTPSFRTVIPSCNRWADVYELSGEQWDNP